MKRHFFFTMFALTLSFPQVAAHCLLCTAGAVAAAGGAAYLGVASSVIGVFLGAASISMGLWMNRLLKRQYIHYQRSLLALVSFLTTVLPLVPLLKDIRPLTISMAGGYGSLFNRTYLWDTFLLASMLGGLIVLVAPMISRAITATRSGAHIPYQGIVLMFVLLGIAGTILQFFS